MTPDLDYTRRVLEVFEASPWAHPHTDEFVAAGIDNDEVFMFHMELLHGQDLVRGAVNGQIAISGRSLDGKGGHMPPQAFRLMAAGHSFLAATRSEDAMPVVKRTLVTQGFEAAASIARALMIAAAMKAAGLSG